MKIVEMLRSLATTRRHYRFGKVYEVDDALGDEWIAKNLAKPTDALPDHLQELYARLDDGAGKPCLFLPFLGEFGHMVMSHTRLVHFHKASRKVVCCRPCEKVLFPSADEFVTDWIDPHQDVNRLGTMQSRPEQWPDLIARFPDHHAVAAGGLDPRQEKHCIHKDIRIPFSPTLRDLPAADVVLGVRQRASDPAKNWLHWQIVADALIAQGYSVAVAGHRATSLTIDGQLFHTGDYDTAAAIEALQKCKLFISTDTGVAHLAAEVGTPMLVFGFYAGSRNDYRPRMSLVNPNVVPLNNGWSNPQAVIDRALELLPPPKKSPRRRRRQPEAVNDQ